MKEFYVNQKPFTFQDKFWRISQDFFDSWNGEIKENETFFNSEYMDSGLDILFSIEGNKIPFHEKYKNISKQMSLSYWDVLPKFEKDNIINSYRNAVSSEYSREFLEFYIRTQRVFKTFSSFRMPTNIEDRWLKGCDENGITKEIKYSRTSTVTGRLKVISGPEILTINRTIRDNFLPLNPENVLISIDFSALEPNISLVEQGLLPLEDPYTELVKKGWCQDRKEAKIMTMLSMYMSDIDPIKNPKNFLIKKFYFNFKIFSDVKKNKRNKYGRKLLTEDENLFESHYVQSMGVDLTIDTFDAFVEDFKGFFEPKYILHDALVGECKESMKDEILLWFKNFEKNIYGVPFPVKIS